MYASTGLIAASPTALGRQQTFSNTSILRIISFSHHQAVVYPFMGISSKFQWPDASRRQTTMDFETDAERWKFSTAIVKILPPYQTTNDVILKF